MAQRTRKILNVALATETRAEYGLLLPVYRAIAAQPTLRPTFIASGMHHVARFGRTIRQIRTDGVRVREIRTTDGLGATAGQRARNIGLAVTRYAQALRDMDWLLVLGDRVEMLAAATAATALGLAIGHLHAGDVAPGAGDDANRHAITKLAHLHFPASRDAAARVRRLGEQPWRIRLAGAPAIDAMRQLPRPAKADLDRLAGFDTAEPFALVVQHAAGFSTAQERRHLSATLSAVAQRFSRAVVIGPGLDRGSADLHATIEKFARRRPAGWRYFRSLAQADYFALMARAAIMVGNSSSGIIESASFALPTVDVGPRQAGRLHSANVIHCGYGRPAVAAAMARVLDDPGFARRLRRCRNVYGIGGAGQKVARALAGTPIDRRLLIKRVAY